MRNKFLKWTVALVMMVITGRLFVIQIVQHDEWVEKAAAQQQAQYALKAQRGEIYMLDGDEPVAVVLNATVYTVIVDPLMANEDEVKEKLDKVLSNKRTAEWQDVFADKAVRYYIIGKNVERKAAEEIAKLNLEGVWLQANTQRVYPEGTLASTVLGFVNADGIGQYGVEGALDARLSGKDGLLKTVKDINNVALSIGEDNVKIPAEDGEAIVLTLDRNMQYRIERILEQQSRDLGFKNISAVVMDPNTGRVMAMVNQPGYDPGDYGNVNSAADYINHVVEDPYEPASVCKTFTFATGMEFGVMTADKTYFNTGEITVDGWPIKNAEQGANVYGTQTMQTALNYSLNTGSTQVLRWLGGSETEITAQARERLYDYYYNHFGLGKETGIELIEQLGSITEPHAEVYGLASTYANMTFGQNMQVTMLQVAAAMASVVNGGYYYRPYIVAGEMRDGNFVPAEQETYVRTTVSPETSAAMRAMLWGTRGMWRQNGTDAAGYYVGGKTGTAQVIRDGKYVLDETIATYVGFGGTEGELPRYLIMVRIWEDGKMADGQGNALPVFNAIKGYVQEYLKVRPKEH